MKSNPIKRSVIASLFAVVLTSAACTDNPRSSVQGNAHSSDTIKSETHMSDYIAIAEIPTVNFERASAFYQAILNIEIEEVKMGDVRMGLFPNSDAPFVQLINGADYRPSSQGTIVYLEGGDDLQAVLDKVTANGGKIIAPKTEIGDGMGFFAFFQDTEGNRLGLHSPR